MNAEQHVPQFRFKGFSDSWEQRKLGELGLNISDGNWIEKQHISDNGQYRIIQTGNIGVDEYLDKPQSAKYFHQEDFNQLRANEIFPGDIVVCRLADPAGRAVILPNIGKQMVTSVDVAILRPSSRISFHFLVSQLNSPHNLKQVQVMASGSTRTRISRKNLEKEIIQLPNIEEQKQIGAFFKQLDNLITLHQRKLELLKRLKQGYLQKLFPQNGENIPELRFKGYSDAWEKRKLGEVTTIFAGGDIEKERLNNTGKYPVISNALTRDGIVGYYEDYKVHAPAVTVTGRGDVGHARSRHTSYTPIVRLLTVQSKSFDSDFLASVINNTNILVESTGVPQLTSPQLGSYHVSFPLLTEQRKIGQFITVLEDLIAATQHKVDLLKKLKQGYLQKMFC